tara:strand:- start:9 stop:227 length:219 start_codon:yes stop_codon:yes gene_type:complete
MKEIFMHNIFISKNLSFNTNYDININMNIFVIWLVMVIAWNFGYPEASPLEDVIVAVILSLLNIALKKYLKF